MDLADVTLSVGSNICRNLPYFRGLGRLCRLFNTTMLSLGAHPIVTAPLKDGTLMRVDLRANTESGAYYLGEYDTELITVVCGLLPPDSVFLDIGANVGFYTVAISNFLRYRYGSGHVLAFEPFEANYQRIIENVELNKLKSFCTITNLALSNQAGTSHLTLREDFQSGSHTGNAAIAINQEFDAGFRQVAIQTACLDDIWHHYKNRFYKIDVIKLDIEGHEDYFLEGARQTIETYRPTILMEVNKPYYEARGLEMDGRFIPLLPRDYHVYRKFHNGWNRISSLRDCAVVDNVFLVPAEKRALIEYATFN